MMQVTAMPRPMAVLLSASEIPFASSADRSSGLAAATAPKARIRPMTVPRRPTRVAMFGDRPQDLHALLQHRRDVDQRLFDRLGDGDLAR